MQGRAPRYLSISRLAAIAVLTAFPALASEGFGWVKMTANLTRIHPPQVFISGARLAVRASATDYKGNSAAQRLKSEVESRLIANDRRLSIDDSKPETVIDLKVLQNEYGDTWENRQMRQQYDTGRKDSKGRTVYDWRDVTVRFKIVHYSFEVAYKVFEPRSGRSLAADTLRSNSKTEYQEGNGAPDASTLESDAIGSVTSTLTGQLTPTREVVGVLIPKGSFEAAGAFATSGLWNKYLDSLEKMPARPNKSDDAYRDYAMGLAYEALGYGAEDTDTTLKYLEQASTHYNDAIDANPKEGYFRQAYESVLMGKKARSPLDRVQEALVQYQKLKEFAESAAAGKGGDGATGAKGDLAGGSDAITNASVIDMLRAGLAEDVIITSIKSAKSTAFDVSPKGLIQLADAKASKSLIQKIQAAANGAKDPPSSERPKPKPTSKTAKKPS